MAVVALSGRTRKELDNMRTRLRLGAATAIALGALLLATVLASPALAWHSSVEVTSACLDDGQVGVSYTVTAWEEGHDASVKVFYELNGEKTDLPSGEFNDKQSSFSGEFVLPAGTTGEVTVTAVAYWKDDGKSTNSGSTKLPDKCKPTETTAPSTTAPPTTAPPTTAPPTTAPPTTAPPTTAPSSSVAPTTSLETTTSGAAGGVTSTTAGGGQLPFTGASSGPMLLAGIVLVGGGTLFLLLSRARNGHATK
jgi:predicted RecA/RadA family phage recombinase